MEWSVKVKLFEEIRREYEFGEGTIKGVAKKLGVHRRLVRQAIANALPPTRKPRQWQRPKIDQVKDFIEAILISDRNAPRKQRHTAHRIYQRIRAEKPEISLSESSVRHYVSMRKQVLGLIGRESFVPQHYDWGVEAQVDWYQAIAQLNGEMQTVEVFSMRSMASGAAFHRAYLRATQQAFFEAHELGFEYFGGVPHRLRYDNLKSAIKKILRGHSREENTRFIAFRSHWKFASEFCNPQKGNEKGGVEAEVGYFRRNHFVPVPVAKDLASLNEQLLVACREDQNRMIAHREQSVGAGMLIEREHLLALANERFELAEISFPIVDNKARVKLRNNW
ncbi:MAG: IS21 family transposase [Acidobacteriota bacterium]